MKKFLIGFLLVLTSLFNGFVIGAFIGGELFTSKGDGMAAGATVFLFGAIAAVIGIIAAIVMLRKLNENGKTRAALFLTVATFALLGLLYHKFQQKEKEKKTEIPITISTATIDPVAEVPLTDTPISSSLRLTDGSKMGIGIVSIFPKDGEVLRFYGKPGTNQLAEHLSAVDSLTFSDARHFVDVATAPPWFVPHYMKLDHQILQLVAVTARKNWVEVIVNRTNGKTAWIGKEDVKMTYWPQFLLSVQSVELLNAQDFPPRVKPMDHASPISSLDPNGIFYPIAVKDDWLQVHPDHETDQEIWIRWKKDGVLLVGYSMLS